MKVPPGLKTLFQIWQLSAASSMIAAADSDGCRDPVPHSGAGRLCTLGVSLVSR